MSERNTLAVKDHKLLIEIDNNFQIINFALPFFIQFVFESELDAAATDLSRVNEQQRHLVGCEGLLPYYVVNYRFRLVVGICCEPALE